MVKMNQIISNKSSTPLSKKVNKVKANNKVKRNKVKGYSSSIRMNKDRRLKNKFNKKSKSLEETQSLQAHRK